MGACPRLVSPLLPLLLLTPHSPKHQQQPTPHHLTGRLSFSAGEQALMFFAGANSIFNGDKLLTTPNPEFDADTVRGNY